MGAISGAMALEVRGDITLVLIKEHIHCIMECERPESGKQKVYHQKFNQ